MHNGLSSLFSDDGTNLRAKVIGIYLLLIGANVAAWLWALIAFHNYPILFGTATLAYTFGLRHAFDADHIAAIDNVTRKLMQEGTRPVAVGFFFSLGHSTIVVALSIAIVITATALQSRFDNFTSVGGIVGTLVSALFLFAIAIANILILRSIYRTFQVVKSGGKFVEEDLDLMLSKRGFMGRILRRFFHLIERSWHMYPLGVLFGRLWCELRERSITCRQIVRTIELTKVLNMDELFKGRHFDREIIVLCVRWYLRYKLSFRDLVEMMAERGLSLAHTTIMRWIQRYAPEFEKRWNRFARPAGRSWRVDETYVKIKGRWAYLYRAVDKEGKTVDFLFAPSGTSPRPRPSSGLLSGARGDCRLKSRSTVIRPHIAQPKRPWTNIPREINARSDPQTI